MRIGLYGGCFNPIHAGHLAAARGAVQALGLDHLCFIPSGNPPMKGSDGLAPGKHRLSMIERAIENEATMSVSAIEITRAGPSFTVDTVRALQGSYPAQTEFFFLLGDDCVARLPKWKGVEDLHTMLRFAILPRTGERAGEADPRLIWLPLPRLAISSTQIRAMIARGERPASALLSPAVADYIIGHNLYPMHSGQACA